MFNYGRFGLACSGLWHLVITDCSLLVWSGLVWSGLLHVHGSRFTVQFDVVIEVEVEVEMHLFVAEYYNFVVT